MGLFYGWRGSEGLADFYRNFVFGRYGLLEFSSSCIRKGEFECQEYNQVGLLTI
jgi:hypothetical protein